MIKIIPIIIFNIQIYTYKSFLKTEEELYYNQLSLLKITYKKQLKKERQKHLNSFLKSLIKGLSWYLFILIVSCIFVFFLPPDIYNKYIHYNQYINPNLKKYLDVLQKRNISQLKIQSDFANYIHKLKTL
jgi:hypothetical protein